MPPTSTEFQVRSMFLFKQTNRKRVRISGYELWEIDNDGLIAESGDGTTNVAFSEDEKELYVIVVKDPKDPQAKSNIVKIANVK
jgi:hypothetical protein